jgi:hypothetical protein
MTINKNLAFAALAALTVALVSLTSITRADQTARDHRNATVTWTKWVTAWVTPTVENGMLFGTIAGVADGDIGVGTVTGEAFNKVSPGVFEADYHFVGSKHSMTVHFNIVQTGLNGVAIGIVTEGWLKGNSVAATFVGYPCDSGITGVCFDGSLEIQRGSKDKD